MNIDISKIVSLALNNKETIVYIAVQLAAILGWGVNNFQNVKKEAILKTEELAKENGAPLIAKDKLNKAVDYFYDNYLTKFIPAWLIGLIIPRQKVESLIQAEFDRICAVGQKKTLDKLGKL